MGFDGSRYLFFSVNGSEERIFVSVGCSNGYEDG